MSCFTHLRRWLGLVILLGASPTLAQGDSLARQIEQAHQRALCTLDHVLTLYEARIEQADDPVAAWNRNGRLRKWLGQLSPTDQAAVAEHGRLLRTMRRRLRQREVQYVIDREPKGRCAKHHTNAYVHLADTTAVIYVCDRWRSQQDQQRVATLLHELMHTFGYDHPNDTDTPFKAFHLAKDHPELARQSPENFESWVEYYVCKLE